MHLSVELSAAFGFRSFFSSLLCFSYHGVDAAYPRWMANGKMLLATKEWCWKSSTKKVLSFHWTIENDSSFWLLHVKIIISFFSSTVCPGSGVWCSRRVTEPSDSKKHSFTVDPISVLSILYFLMAKFCSVNLIWNLECNANGHLNLHRPLNKVGTLIISSCRRSSSGGRRTSITSNQVYLLELAPVPIHRISVEWNFVQQKNYAIHLCSSGRRL